MPVQLTADDAKESLSAHAAAKGAEVRTKYGPEIGWEQLQGILKDRACVRYPCEIGFDKAQLQSGEFAFPAPLGDGPEAGFILHVHPLLQTRPEQLAAAVLYQLVAVNYGEFASPEDAETFGAAALGVSREVYYQDLCQLADEIEALDAAAAHPCACG
jgi:hypothetical protein